MELDEARFELRRTGRAIELEPTPFRLLQHLIWECERVVSKEGLLEAVWPDVDQHERGETCDQRFADSSPSNETSGARRASHCACPGR